MEPQRQQLMVNNRKYQADGGEAEGGHGDVRCWADVNASAVKPSIGSTTGCTITEKAPTRAVCSLHAVQIDLEIGPLRTEREHPF